MLARLDAIAGVERSLANRSGTLIRLSLHPDADAEMVAEAAARVLSDEDQGRPPVRLSAEAAIEAVQVEEWRDASRIDELTAIEMRTLLLRGLLALAVLAAGIGGLIWWWRRRKRLAGTRANS